MKFEVYVGNLGKYNEGEIVGGWITLPTCEAELQEFLIGTVGLNEGYEEYHIQDTDISVKGLDIYEYSNLDDLNSLAEELANFNSYELEIIETLLELGYIKDEDIINGVDLGDYTIIKLADNTDEALGEALAEDLDLDSKFGNLASYFDYEKFGRDCRLDGWDITENCFAIYRM